MKKLNILVANQHLKRTGGTENYTYALALALKRLGHNVDYFCFDKGEVSDRLEESGIPFLSRHFYDLILANHIYPVRYLRFRGIIVQTSHGLLPELEQPSEYADYHVAVSAEIQNYINSLGFRCELINNGIDCSRFSPINKLSNKLTKVLSLCQSERANNIIKGCCEELKVSFVSLNKFTDNVWNVEKYINEVDLVIGIGRSLYDSMACGRCVISFDYRDYMDHPMGSGYLNGTNIQNSIYHNCTGREREGHYMTKDDLIKEMLKYDPTDGEWARQYSLSNLNIDRVVNRYLSFYSRKRVVLKYIKLIPEIINFFPNKIFKKN